MTWGRNRARMMFDGLSGLSRQDKEHEPEAIKRIVDQDIEQARAELRSHLTGLLAWARATGRT